MRKLSINKRAIKFAFIIAIVLLIFHDKPNNYGFCLGDWKLGLLLTFGSIILIAPVLWLVTHGNLEMQDYYQNQLDHKNKS